MTASAVPAIVRSTVTEVRRPKRRFGLERSERHEIGGHRRRQDARRYDDRRCRSLDHHRRDHRSTDRRHQDRRAHGEARAVERATMSEADRRSFDPARRKRRKALADGVHQRPRPVSDRTKRADSKGTAASDATPGMTYAGTKVRASRMSGAWSVDFARCATDVTGAH